MIAPVYAAPHVSPRVEVAFASAWLRMAMREGHRKCLPGAWTPHNRGKCIAGEDRVLAAIRAGARTADEVAEALGLSASSVRPLVRTLRDNGLVRVCRVPHQDLGLDGAGWKRHYEVVPE